MKKVFLLLTMFLFAFTGVTRANVQQNRADQVIEQGFEDGLGDWTMNHCHSSSGVTSSYGGNTGSYAFRFYYTTNYPQYLISPELDDNDGVNFTFYAARYSSSYPETFKVGYSSTTNEPTEFTWGSEVTCTTMYGAGAYQEYSYDFPAGTKYVSIACTSNDQFYMFVDDITVTLTPPAAGGTTVEVTIGDPTSTTTNQYLPGYTLYDYAISQQIYTADEIGVAGTINTLTMWLKNSSSYARNINVYMKEVAATEFANNSAWESFTASDMVASFTMPNGNATPIEVALDLSAPFEYSGNDNLVICFQDVTGQWSSGLGGVEMDATGNQALYAYRDGTVYDPSNPGVNGTLLAKKNVIRLSIMTGGGEPTTLTTTPDVLDLGYRPNGAWMAPYVFTINGTGTTVNALDFSGNYFTYNAELPATLTAAHPLEVTLTTGEAEEGPVNSTMTVLFGGNRDAQQFNVTATAYNPVDGDVWEKALTVTTPYAGTTPTEIYHNYNLPDDNMAPEAMYKLTFAEDVMLTAGTDAADGSAFLYPEGFDGIGGPDVDNYYVYNGPEADYPTEIWFYYDWTGSTYNLGYNTAGNLYFGYMIPKETLQEYELGNCAITTVETVLGNFGATYCDLFILKGGDTPDVNNLYYYQEFTDFTPGYYFDITLDEPVFLGDDENIWIMFATDNMKMYVGANPIDPAGKVWYSRSATTWYSDGGYTPVIFTHFLEIPTGREVTLNASSMKVREGQVAEASEITAIEGMAMGTPKAQKQVAKSDRSTPVNIENMFVPAGTYYLAVASNEPGFNVNIETAEVTAPEQAVVMAPLDGEANVGDLYYAYWYLGDYTTEMQVILGTQYPPQTVLVDWTDELIGGIVFNGLQPNQSYFMQVNERNAGGTTMGEIVAFTTPIDPVEGFAAASTELYPGENAVFTWDANRSFQGYNIYMDGEKLNETPITETTYTVEGLEYNMTGYNFYVTAVYDAGESLPSDVITVKMTGMGTVTGHVYDAPDYDPADPDQSHPIAGATVTCIVLDEYNHTQTFEFTTDEEGFYTAEVLAGMCVPAITTEGYENAVYDGLYVMVEYQGLYEGIDIYTHEFYYPLSIITATEEENDVLVEWSWTPAAMIVDFETGDFSQADFTLPATYPWTVTTTNPYEGTYCMKSTCEGVASGISSIEATVDVPFDAKMSFWVRVSSESNYDKFHFYIDGVEQGQALSGQLAYAKKEYTVAAGTHTYKWEYAKDSSVNSNDDCVYVDNITMYEQDIPLPPIPGATLYDFEDQTMMGWTSIDADSDGYGWVSSADPGIYHNSGVSLAGTGHNESQGYVISGSYSNSAGIALHPDNYLVAPTQISAQDGAAISFYVCAQDAGYPAEHFGVAVSTGAAAAADFTTIQEWTLTAKRDAKTEDRNSEIRGTRAQGAWYNYQVDLSAYAGQDIWVAIRHFNCSDEFILNLDDITLGDGSAKGDRGSRSLMSYNLYRRNNVDTGDPELIAEGLDSEVMSYTDAEWPTLPFGVYQWGIQATYEGYAPVPERSREDFAYDFEGGLMGWTAIDADGDGHTWYHSSESYTYSCYAYTGLGHDGTDGFAYSQSYTDCTYDSYDPNNFLVSPQQYSIGSGANMTFWADYANDSYPDHFGVAVATAANPTASDFTMVWEGSAKGANNGGEKVRHSNTRYENWREHNIDLSAYEGQNIWIAFRHYDSYDEYELWIDDVTISTGSSAPVPPTPGPTGDGLSEILWSNEIEKDMEATFTFNVSLNNGQSPAGATVAMVGAENTYNATIDEEGTAEIVVRKGDTYEITIEKYGYTSYTETMYADSDVTITTTLVEIVGPVEDLYVSPTGWAMWKGDMPTPTPGPTPPGPTPPTPGQGQWYQYGTDVVATGVGAGGAFYWAVMFPAGTYTGNMVTKAATYEMSGYGFSGTVTIYNDGATAPANAVGTMPVTVAGSSDGWAEFEFASPLTIDPTKNLWVVFYNETSSSYPAAACDDAGDANARWVSLDGSSWMDLATAGLSGYSWIMKVYVAEGAKGEVREISVPTMPCVNAGKLSTGELNRTALSYKIMLDGEYLGETTLPFYQFDVDNMEEGSTHVAAVAPLYSSGMGDWMEYTWTYTACSNFNGMQAYEGVDGIGMTTVNWTLPGGQPGPTPPGPSTDVTYDFDDSTLQGWTTIDGGSPSGYGWSLGSNKLGTGYGHNGSNDMVLSQSYDNNYGVVYPDNYLISPEKGRYTQISLYACGQDASYAAEHFGVAVSTGNATAADFVMVNEWTIGTKGERYDGARGMRDQSAWTLYTVDLSAYAGQDIWVAVRHFNCSDMFYLDVDDITLSVSAKAERSTAAMWDLLGTFNAAEGGHYGVVTDGEYIYTSNWGYSAATHNFYKYDMEGNMIEGFEVPGCGTLRGMTFDGEYIYGVANSSTIYCVDLNNHTLVGTTTSAYGAMRGITYDPARDGFWVIGNWSGNLTLIDRTGAIVQAGPAPSSASDLAYYADPDGVEHVFCFNNGTNDVDDYNIATNTITPAVFNFNSIPGYDGGSSGGCHVATYAGKTAFFGDIQQSPNLIGIYELDGDAPVPPTPPTPAGDIVGAVLYRDGEFVGIFDANTTSFSEELPVGAYEYTIRVIYGGDYDVTYYAMSCPETITVHSLPDAIAEDEVVNSIYPNPTSGDLHINAEAMTHVTVFNAMGQMVYNQDVNGDSMVLNMGQFESGVYMVRIDTENGSSVKRITVAK